MECGDLSPLFDSIEKLRLVAALHIWLHPFAYCYKILPTPSCAFTVSLTREAAYLIKVAHEHLHSA
jgi:hypothetical protein